MKRRQLWLALLCLVISVCMCLCVAGCGGCNSCDEDTSTPAALAVPEVTIDDDGVASWQAVENAVGYMYRIDGEDTSTENTAVQLSDGQSIRVKAVADGKNYYDSGWSKIATFVQTFTLSTPVVTIAADGTASWEAVLNATAYMVETGGSGSQQTELSVHLENGQSVRVAAIGDGGIYKDSAYSEAKTYNKLSAPQISVNDSGLASWGGIAHATGYKYKLNDETAEHTADGLSVQLSNGYKILVKAVGGDGWFDSDWANASYFDKTKIIKLAAPEVTIEDVNGVNGIAIWAAVEHASGYVYKISGGEEVPASGLSCSLKANETITVKAVGDGKFYSDSEWSDVKKYEVDDENLPVTLAAPVVMVGEDGVARWSAVSGADWYEIEIDGKYDSITTQLYKQLSDGQVIRVKAVDEKDNESDFSKPVKYVSPAPEPVIGNGVKFDFACIDEVGSAAYGYAEATADFKTACGNSNGFDEVASTEKLFKGSGNETGLLKFGDESGNGFVTLTFKKQVLRVVIICKKYGGDSCALSVNGSSAKSPATTVQELVFDLATPALKIRIEAEKRCIVYGVVVYFALPTVLNKPVVSIDEDGLATWNRDGRASGYTYSINGGEEQIATELGVQLSDGDSIVVTAVGDWINYTSSVSDEQTFNWIKRQLDAPKINIDPKTGVASWKQVEHADFYIYTVYHEYGYKIDEGLLERGEDLSVQLEKNYSIDVQACSNFSSLYDDSQVTDKKTYNYYPETVEPDGTPLIFDFTVLTEKGELANPKYIFGKACGNSDCFESASASKVELGNQDTNGAVTGAGFIKVGSANVSGSITLTFNKRVYGVVIKCRTWNSKNVDDKVQVNGSELQNAGKNGWAELTFNFGRSNASDTVEIVTKNRIFIEEIIVYVEE